MENVDNSLAIMRMDPDLANTEETGDVLACLKSYYIMARFTDLTISTAEQEFKVHKLVICSHSGYFSRMFKGEWAEDSEIKLKHENPVAVASMIGFMYGLEYRSSASRRISPMLFNISVYQIAEKYDVPKLKTHALLEFEGSVDAFWNTDDFPPAIVEAYQSTSQEGRGLRDSVIRVTHDHIDELLTKEDFRHVFENTMGFAADVAERLAQQRSNSFSCPSCQTKWLMEPIPENNWVYCPACTNEL